MTGLDSGQPSSRLTAENTAIRHLEEAVAGGRDWYVALLEAIALWDVDEETRDGRLYRYLIDGEALDWMVVAERLCAAVDGLLPEDEKLAFLFHGEFPSDITAERFKELVGSGRYHQYLNYFYGITVEEALFRTVREEVRKEKWVSGFSRDQDPSDEVYVRVYGQSRTALLREFRKEWCYPHRRSTSLLEMKEFTYWLFKYRLKRSDKARVASDTRKGLDWLHNNGLLGRTVTGREGGI
jgi:hypothetical protein